MKKQSLQWTQAHVHEERHNSEIEKILYDYFGDRVNVYDRKVTVLVKKWTC